MCRSGKGYGEVLLNLLPLQQSILYGPVSSRRLGRSLGINLMPHSYKLCSFNCVYCHYGWTSAHTKDIRSFVKDLPAFDDVIEALQRAFASETEFEYVTFSGNGEPTLYPRFTELVAELGRMRDRYRPEVKIALLSNSTGLNDEATRKSIGSIDLPVMKLDAGTRQSFCAINRPAAGIDYDEICDRLQGMEGVFIQTVFVHGSPCNTGPREIAAFFGQIRKIKPAGVHIYSIDRPVPNACLTRVLPGELEDIASRGSKETGVEMRAFYLGQA